MKSFDAWMGDYQSRWRKTHIASNEWGWWDGKQYPWILPHELWEEGLWPGIRTGSPNSLPQYLVTNDLDHEYRTDFTQHGQ